MRLRMCHKRMTAVRYERDLCLSCNATCARRRDVCAANLAAALAFCFEGLAATRTAQAAYVDEEAAQSVFESSSLSVVAIEDFESGVSGLVAEGVGSGFIWDNFGHVVTNYHCISKLARDQSGKQVAPKTLVTTNPARAELGRIQLARVFSCWSTTCSALNSLEYLPSNSTQR